jgi:AraC-like DNA-binding protein
MLVTPTRIAYRSLFGRPGVRTFGAWFFYVALEQPFEISCDRAPAESRCIALVPPYVPHRVSTPDRALAQVLLESETIEEGRELLALIDTPSRAAETRQSILAGFDRPLDHPESFDAHFLGISPIARVLDPRVMAAIQRMSGTLGENLTAEDCAQRAGLSFSRFTHLFTRQTGTSFRRLRAWKRARGLMPLVRNSASLVDVALDTGYADSTHFSHSIRQFYGYKPSDIFSGSRKLSVVAQWPQAIAA